jgi:hypothetical protein
MQNDAGTRAILAQNWHNLLSFLRPGDAAKDIHEDWEVCWAAG